MNEILYTNVIVVQVSTKRIYNPPHIKVFTYRSEPHKVTTEMTATVTEVALYLPPIPAPFTAISIHVVHK